MKPNTQTIVDLPSNAVALTSQPQTDVERIILTAIDKSVPVETMERLLAMRDKLKADNARDAFFRSLSQFQSKCPIIPKTKKAGSGNFAYKYAPLEVIQKHIGGLLVECGLSYTFDTEDDPTHKTTICKLHHIGGHSEVGRFKVPIDTSARMNATQKEGSASTYSKRYALCNALGILTGDEDDDGAGSGSHAAGRAPDRDDADPSWRPTAREEEEMVAAASKPSETPKAAIKFPTTQTLGWMIEQLKASGNEADSRMLVTDYFRACGQLLPTEEIENLPLRFVPATMGQLRLLAAKIAAFEQGDQAVIAFPQHEPPDDPPKKAKARPVEVPRDAAVGGWRTFPVPFGKNAGKTLGGLAENSLTWYVQNFRADPTFEGRDGNPIKKRPEALDKDKAFRTALDAAAAELGISLEAPEDQDRE